jgi:hypothetical protein
MVVLTERKKTGMVNTDIVVCWMVQVGTGALVFESMRKLMWHDQERDRDNAPLKPTLQDTLVATEQL